MAQLARGAQTGHLPRMITPSTMWGGGFLTVDFDGAVAYGHLSLFVIKGSQKTIMIDTGHPLNVREVEGQVEQFLDGRPLDYIFPTHAEFPHAGLLDNWMRKYPQAQALCGVGDYSFYFPHLADRITVVKEGDRVNLGDRDLIFLPAVWRDVDTLWAFDTLERVLFVADGFSYLNPHHPNQHDWMTSERPPIDPLLIRYFNERALNWTQFTHVENTFADIDRLVTFLKPNLIASAHGNIVDTTEDMLPLVKRGMGSAVAEPQAKPELERVAG